MSFLVLAVLVAGGFWWWARTETLKKNPRVRYQAQRRASTQAIPGHLTRNQQVLVWTCILGTQMLVMNRHFLINSFGVVGNSGEGTGFGQVDARNLANFPPPDLYQEIGGTSSAVTLINGSPDALRINLVKDTGDRISLELPRCEECRPYSEEETPECGSVGTPVSYQIPPGVYKATGYFSGPNNTKGFVSDWSLSQGWEYRMCLYTLDEVHFY